MLAGKLYDIPVRGTHAHSWIMAFDDELKAFRAYADAFPEHEEAPVVLGAAADDLYEMKDFERAIASARKLVDRYPASDRELRRSAWAVVAHSSIDIAEYQDAEFAYTNVLQLTPEEDESRQAIIDGIAHKPERHEFLSAPTAILRPMFMESDLLRGESTGDAEARWSLMPGANHITPRRWWKTRR